MCRIEAFLWASSEWVTEIPDIHQKQISVQYPQLMDDGRNVGRLLNQKLCFQAQLSLWQAGIVSASLQTPHQSVSFLLQSPSLLNNSKIIIKKTKKKKTGKNICQRTLSRDRVTRAHPGPGLEKGHKGKHLVAGFYPVGPTGPTHNGHIGWGWVLSAIWTGLQSDPHLPSLLPLLK